MYGVPQIGDGNLNYEYNPYMNNHYGQIHQSGNQIDLYNKFNVPPNNYPVNNQIDIYGHNNYNNMTFNQNIQSQSEFMGYPSIQSSNSVNITRSDLNSMNSKTTTKDPLSELFG